MKWIVISAALLGAMQATNSLNLSSWNAGGSGGVGLLNVDGVSSAFRNVPAANGGQSFFNSDVSNSRVGATISQSLRGAGASAPAQSFSPGQFSLRR